MISVGSKSILFGAHAFWLHPLFVAWGWWLTYTWPRIRQAWYSPPYRRHSVWRKARATASFLWNFVDPRLWLAFAVHDLGYWAKPELDGPEGERHPELGARILGWFDGSLPFMYDYWRIQDWICRTLDWLWGVNAPGGITWHDFVLYHSRYLAKQDGRRYSLLCIADKQAALSEPRWLYLPRVIATGEVWLYMETNGYDRRQENILPWYNDFATYMERWIAEHQGGHKEDTWTQARR